MPFNFNGGWGRQSAESVFPKKAHAGKSFLVIASTNPYWQKFTEMVPQDPNAAGVPLIVSTLQAALDNCTNSGDDVVYVAPYHAENIASAGAIATGASIAGTSIIGLGEGSARPTFTFITATTASITIASAGITIENVIFDLTGVDALANPINVTGSDFTLRKCKVLTGTTTNQAVLAVLTSAAADNITIEDCLFWGQPNAAGTTSAIRLVGNDGVVIKNNTFIGPYKLTAGAIEASTTAVGLVNPTVIQGNVVMNTTPLSKRAINVITGSRTILVNNRYHVLAGTTPVSVGETASTTAQGFIISAGNYYTNTSTLAVGVLI